MSVNVSGGDLQWDAGIDLIVVAGMDYAAALESKGKDVITGSSLIAEQELKTLFASIKKWKPITLP